MNKRILRISALVLLMTTVAMAQEKQSSKENLLDEVVISDTKFAQSKEKSGKVITKITQEDLLKKSGQNVAQVLSTAVGVEINGNQSANGKNLGYYIRGGKNRQVLVLIDGIPVTDASGISLEYDLRLIPVDQVESIEIMKGASSTLYGTGAASGIINITLKKGGKKGVNGNAYVNIGSNNTATNSKVNGQDFNQGISLNARSEKVNFYTAFNSTETGGMSQIAPTDPSLKYENDHFSRLNYVAKVGVNLTKKLNLDGFANYDQVNNDYDFPFSNTGLDDTDKNKTKTEQFRFGFVPKYKYNKGEFILNSSFNKIQRSYDELNLWTNGIEYSLYKSRSVVLDGYNKYNFNKSFFLVTGVNYQFHDMATVTPYDAIDRNSTKFNMVDPYFTGVYSSDSGLNLNLGARYNMHSQYGNQGVFNINPSFNFKTAIPLKVLASFSTAYITPSLYQLYSQYGNTDLTPENNSTIEAGFETQLINKKVIWNVVFFDREEKNSIGFSPSYKYTNLVGINKAKGIETELSYTLNSKVKINGNYAFTQVDDALNRLIPKHKANAALDIQFTKRFLFNASYQYVNGRNDAFFDGNTYAVQNVTLHSYQLVNTLLKYDLVKNRMTVFGTVTNIFNENFIENIGYSTRGRNFKLGVNITL